MDSFVYRWTNKTLNKIYIGFHKGTEDDGYICSSASKKFWEDFNNPEYVWQREILYKGTMKDCQLVESKLIDELDITSELVYNQRNNLMFNLDDEVRNKLSAAAKKRNQNPEYIEKLRQSSKKLWEDPAHRERIKKAQSGKVVSEETRQKLREANLGKKQTKETISKRVKTLTGQKRSEESKKNISIGAKKREIQMKEYRKHQYGFTCPFGEFSSMSSFSEYAKENNCIGYKDMSKIRRLLKDKNNTNWRYINEQV